MPLDEETARLVAVREGINAVISGSLVRRGQGLEVSGKAIDAVTGHVLRSARVSADGKSSLLTAMAKLGASIRSSLGDNTPESIQLAAAETFTECCIDPALPSVRLPSQPPRRSPSCL